MLKETRIPARSACCVVNVYTCIVADFEKESLRFFVLPDNNKNMGAYIALLK